ncbi:thiamine-monophosphate kinase [Halovivax ruber XH-70]|uniref:Thiamine-monophosphate kinase n=1 Tax=Halovivax ruber (strain DSM 18193 / JCM 13892 / XH-70) TaxID=797302 RepID=L0I9Z2_HALRX|nr:thiamine-phosphate kinase [Halovivax ruber]AGB14767.1 thiamine-monophosphate kinase [Halovivax ruber XH-70]
MDERAALTLLGDELAHAGDDAAVVDGQVLTTDMLHETTDFPEGTTRYTAGWRAVGASLSDVAAMGAEATAAVAVYAAPTFDDEALLAFVDGAQDVCERVGARYVGGDLDHHAEFTVATTALGRVPETDGAAERQTAPPVRRSGARPGDVVCVTGTLGRSAAALELFDRGAIERANDLFRFVPRIDAGVALAPHASAMMDSSDGLARSLHQLADASDCGFAIESATVPVDDAVSAAYADESDAAILETALTFGEDFELVFTVAPDALESVRAAVPVDVTVLGEVVESGVTIDGQALPDAGYDHGA